MSNKSLHYIHLQPDAALPDIKHLRPFKAIVLVEEEVLQIWQWEVSRWLVESGCFYMMAWGAECGSWEESVEEASLEAFNYEDVPDEHAVITASHEEEPLPDVFWFAKAKAGHPVHKLPNTIVVHISKEGKKAEIEEQYEMA